MIKVLGNNENKTASGMAGRTCQVQMNAVILTIWFGCCVCQFDICTSEQWWANSRPWPNVAYKWNYIWLERKYRITTKADLPVQHMCRSCYKSQWLCSIVEALCLKFDIFSHCVFAFDTPVCTQTVLRVSCNYCNYCRVYLFLRVVSQCGTS